MNPPPPRETQATRILPSTLIDVTGLPTSFFVTADVDADGRIWLIDNNLGGRIYRQRQKNGSYSLIDCTTMSVMANARTLDGAFAPLETVIRLAEAAQGPIDLKRMHWNIW